MKILAIPASLSPTADVDFGHTEPLLTLPVGGPICILMAPSAFWWLHLN